MKEDWLSNGDENLKTKEMLLLRFKCETAYHTAILLLGIHPTLGIGNWELGPKELGIGNWELGIGFTNTN